MLWTVLVSAALSVRATEFEYLKVANTFVIGVSSCGTSSLFETLVKSPEICAPKDEFGNNIKAPDSFSLPWFWTRQKIDDMKEKFSSCRWDQRRLDSTETYSTKAVVPQNIHVLYNEYGLDPGQIKFIMLIRDPLERAYSWYKNGVNKKLSGFNVTFEEKIEMEIKQLNSCQSYAKSHGITEDVHVWAHCSEKFLNHDRELVFPGMMATALKYYFMFFDPRQFLIIPLQEYHDNFAAVGKRIAKHLNLKDDTALKQDSYETKPEIQLPAIPESLLHSFQTEYTQMAELVKKTPSAFFRVMEQPSFHAIKESVNASRSGRQPKLLSNQQGILEN